MPGTSSRPRWPSAAVPGTADNGFGAAIATGGQRFFYVNPLQRREDHFEKDDPGRRRVWFNCACCPPNIMRLIASLDHYLATESADTLYIHQYTGSRLSGAGLDLEVTTDYPWSGAIYLRVLTVPGVPHTAIAIPYFQWDNRDGGPMRGWMPRA